MKTSLFALLYVCIQLVAAETQPDNVCLLADRAEATLTLTRSNLHASILAQTESSSVDLLGLVATLDRAEAALAQAQVDKELFSATQRVKAARAQLVSSGIQESELEVDFESCDRLLRRISVLRAGNQNLRREISQLRTAVGDLRRWAGVLEPVLSAEEVSQKVKARLRELLKGAEPAGTIAAAADSPRAAVPGPTPGRSDPAETETNRTPTPLESMQTRGVPMTAARTTSTRNQRTGAAAAMAPNRAVTLPINLALSPPTTDVLALVRAEMDQAVILAFVAHARAPFRLGPDQLVYLRAQGVSEAELAAMLQHDIEWRQNSPPPLAPLLLRAPQGPLYRYPTAGR